MRIGLISDTHGYFDPKLNEALAGVEMILHAGDVGSEAVLDELRRIAPVRAVRGNVDAGDSGLPLSLQLTIAGVAVHMIHILPAAQSDLEAWAESAHGGRRTPKAAERLAGAFEPSTGVVLFGHSHDPCLVTVAGILWINPGSAGRKRFSLPRTYGMLDVSSGGLRAEILPLEAYAGRLPEPISWRGSPRNQS